MSHSFEYQRLSGEQDADALIAVLAQCFIGVPDRERGYFHELGSDQFRLIRQADRVLGGLALIPMGQWWGGQSVPMTGIASVGIAPEYRGVGAAIALMQAAVQELHESGVALSVLYPATQRLYRKVGYEQGGSLYDWEISTASIQLQERRLPVLPVAAEPERFRKLYLQQAQQTNGFVDRHAMLWSSVLRVDPPDPLYAYLIGPESQPEGYVVFTQQRTPEGAVLKIRDWVTLTPAAGLSFWSFLSDHRSQIDLIRWRGGAIYPLTLLLPEQTAKIRSTMHWLLRIINLKSALEQRGYPEGITADLHLEVHDPLLPPNRGRFILSVARGQASLTTGGNGDLKLDIRTLAPLYAGAFTPNQLQLTGSLQSTTEALAIASQIFSGPHPWMPDFF